MEVIFKAKRMLTCGLTVRDAFYAFEKNKPRNYFFSSFQLICYGLFMQIDSMKKLSRLDSRTSIS